MTDEAAREAYLRGVLGQYGTLVLPVGGVERGLRLEAVFQPLRLRSDPVAAEDVTREERRRLLGEEDGTEQARTRTAEETGEGLRREPRAEQEPLRAEHGAEALAKSPTRRMVVLGGPGTGKTTALKRLVTDAARAALADGLAPLPIFVLLPDLARAGASLDAYVEGLARDEAGDANPELARTLTGAVAQGQAVLCLDGLDEVAPGQRPGVIAAINAWAAREGNTWIVGSRFTEYKGGQFAHGRFAEWELLALDHEQRIELARRLLPALGRQEQGADAAQAGVRLSPTGFVTALEAHPQAAAWAANPLLFSLAAAGFARTGALPSSRAALYGEVIASVLATREPDAGRRATLRWALAELALRVHLTKGRTFTRPELLEALAGLPAGVAEGVAGDTLAERMIASGTLDVVARETYGFRHQTFQEYLAAVALARRMAGAAPAERAAGWELAWSKRTFSRWTETLRLLVGVLVREDGSTGAEVAGRWVRALVGQRETPDGDPGYLGLALAVRSVAEAHEPAAGTAWEEAAGDVAAAWARALVAAVQEAGWQAERRLQKITAEMRLAEPGALAPGIAVLLDGLRSRHDGVRGSCAGALGALGARAPIGALVALWGDPDLRVRRAAGTALATAGEFAPVETLLEIARDAHARLRPAALKALGAHAGREAREALLAALRDEQADIRQAAVAALGGQRDEESFAAVVGAMRDEQEQIRQAAAHVLVGWGDEAAIEQLIDAAGHTASATRRAAVRALGQLGMRAPVAALLAALDDTDESVRMAAAMALQSCGARPPVEAVVAALDRTTGWQTRSGLIRLLGSLGDRAPVEIIVAALDDAEAQVRAAAAQALVLLGERAPDEALRKALALDLDNWQAQQAVMETISGRAGTGWNETILGALEHAPASVRAAAAQATARRVERGLLEGYIAVEKLLPLVGDDNWMVRGAGAEALCALALRGEDASLARVLAAFARPDGETRAAAVETLGALGQEMPVELAVQALRDSSAEVRGAAVVALGALRERAPAGELVAMLEDADSSVRCQTLYTLARLGGGDHVERIAAVALGDAKPSVRWAAGAMLGRLGDGVSPQTFEQLAHDPDAQVRTTALRALFEHPAYPIQRMVSALDDPDAGARWMAIQALGERAEREREERAVGLGALRAVASGADAHMRHLAEVALVRTDPDVSLDRLLEMLADRDWEARHVAEQRLAGRIEEVAPERLVELLLRSPSSAGWYSALLFAPLGERMPVELLKPLLRHAEPGVRQAAVAVLAHGGARAPLAEILALMDDPETSVRGAAISALKQLGERTPIEALRGALEDSDYSVKLAAASALAARGVEPPMELLLAALTDEDCGVATEALTTYGRRVPLPEAALARLLGSTEECARSAVLEIAREVAPGIVRGVAAEAEAIVRGEAAGPVFGSLVLTAEAHAIGRMKKGAPVPLLERLVGLLDWDFAETRAAAAQALGGIRRNVPDEAIRRLLALRREDAAVEVRAAADAALAEILSLETGIEDE